MNYSIIIPHKNSPDLLIRCLDSIPMRNDIEVIVVDDSSNPAVVDFSDFPAMQVDCVINLFSKEGKGAGHARNLGLERASGKWILFADADDFFEPNAFDHFDKHLDTVADIIYFGVNSKISDTLEPAQRDIYFQNLLYGYKEGDAESEDWLRLRYLVPWGKMMSRKLLMDNDIRFEEIIASNDIMFSAQAGNLARSIAVDYSQVYCVTVAKGSLTNIRSKEVAKIRFEVKLRFNEFVRGLGKGMYQYTVRKELFDAFSYGWNEFFSYFVLACKYGTNFFFALNIGRAIKSMRTYKEEEKGKEKYIIRK